MIQTRVSRFNRLWVCPFCGWRAYVSRRKHYQTGQPLRRAEQIATLTVRASAHFRAAHRQDFARSVGNQTELG